MEYPDTLRFYRKHLPHWEVADGRYFVTIRLKGAIPETGQRNIRKLREQLDEAIANGQDGLRERRMIFREMERWLDQADTINHLTQPHVAEMIQEAIDYREKSGAWTMFAYTLMPNHIHLFFRLGSRSTAPSVDLDTATPEAEQVHRRRGEPTAGNASDLNLENVLKPFKHWTAHHAKKLLGLQQHSFWQREWFDHWSRSPEHDDGIVKYIRNNPMKAGLVSMPDQWPYTWTLKKS